MASGNSGVALKFGCVWLDSLCFCLVDLVWFGQFGIWSWLQWRGEAPARGQLRSQAAERADGQTAPQGGRAQAQPRERAGE